VGGVVGCLQPNQPTIVPHSARGKLTQQDSRCDEIEISDRNERERQTTTRECEDESYILECLLGGVA